MIFVYIFKEVEGLFIYILLYVDYILIAAKCMECIYKIKFQIGHDFEMKDLGSAKRISGKEIKRN